MENDENTMLYCQRFPASQIGEDGNWYQPLVADVDWCGEWQKREAQSSS